MAQRPVRGEPAYVKVEKAVLTLARSGHLGPTDKIPSERRLAMELGLSRMTVRQGVENLVRAGVLRRDSTAGTRLADINVVRMVDTRRAISMTEIVKISGARPGSRLLAFALTDADRATAERLRIAGKSPVVFIRRLRTANAVPFCIEECYLPASLVPGLVAEDLARDASLYELLRRRYGVQPTDKDTEISVERVRGLDARLLGLEQGLNVLIYRGLTYDADGRQIECLTSINHPRMVVFSTQVPRIKI